MVTQESFGSLVRRYRREAELTQEALAELAGLSVRAIRTIETERGYRPRQDTVRLLLTALSIPVAEQARFLAAAAQVTEQEDAVRTEQHLPTGGFAGSLPVGPVIGREAEMSRILTAIDAVERGEGRLVLLAGEPGSGKTRLLQEATGAALERGFLVAAGRCYEPEQAVPWYPFVDAFATLWDAAPAAVRDKAAERWPYLGVLFPERLAVPTTSERSRQDEQQRVFRELTGFLEAMTELAPIALLLDDLHWADGTSLKLLRHIATHTRSRRLLLLGAYRDVEVGLHPPLEGALRDLAREALLERIPVRRLEEAGTAQLIAAIVGEAAVSEAFAEHVHSRTEGNPFFIQQVMWMLVERGGPVSAGSRWDRRQFDSLEVPESIRSVIGQRLSRLSDAAHTLLRDASVLGQTFGFGDLLAISESTEDELEMAFEEARAARLVFEADRDAHAFDHALTHQTLYAELPFRRRRRLHLAAGEAIERLPDRTREHRVSELAHHFLEAADAERALSYALRAGASAEAAMGYSEAEWQYRTASRLAGESDNALSEAEAREKLGHVLVITGRADQAADELERAIGLYHGRAQVDVESRAIAELALLNFERGQVDLTIEQVRSALMAMEDPGPSVTLGRLHLAEGAYYWRKGQPQEARTSALRALDIARLAGDELFLIEILVYIAVPERRIGQVGGALEMLEEARRRAEGRGDLFWHSWTELIFGDTYLDTGQLTAAVDAYRRAHDLANRLQNPGRVAWARTGLGLTLRLRGDWDSARQELQGAMEWVQLAEDVGSGFGSPLVFGSLCTLLGQWDEAEQSLARVWEQADHADDPLYRGQAATSLADLERLRGDLDAALGWVERGQDDWTADSRVKGWVFLERGRVAEAEAIAHTGLKQVGNVRLDLPGWYLLLGAVMAEQRRWEYARNQFHAGLAIAREIGMPYEEGLFLYYWGRMDAARGDRDAAERRLKAALAIFDRLGAQPYVARARRALGEIGQP